MTIDSVVRTDKRNYLQVYLEECKYEIKKIQVPIFINAELESESDLELDSDLDSDPEPKHDTAS